MDKNNFITYLYDGSIRFMNISKKMYKFYRNLLGTEVKVTRIKETKYKKLLSATLTDTFQDSDDINEFSYKIIINQSSMLNIWKRNTNQMDVYDIDDKLKTGDLISFAYGGLNYQFKISSTQAYGIGADIVYQYTLIPIIEHHV